MKKMILALVAICSFAFAKAQTTIGDATLPNTMTMAGTELALNGAGLREKLFIDLYVGGLYLQNKSKDAKAILNSDETMNMKLHIVSSLITSDTMISAVMDGFDASTGGDIEPLSSEIAKFTSFFNEEIVDGTIFDIAQVKGRGVVVHRNGKEIGVIEGEDFRKALFGIWLGKYPVDKKLKKGMLQGK